ncbi:GGDEF domain-containing protein [Vibrio navarrensis]|uniref:GGDEF domain-containing protein n=1 Tax=Vibrio navarrensis TaxID=29495 RepID=UPI00186984CF|nr:GGDEF domain-containing protein [Vibrio navarrensis]MBE4593107.1 GGDEF domain-containing protein [Vibrio navarrensis]
MGILESDIQAQLHQLSCQLDQLRLTHRDTSLKFKREQLVLKRIVTSLSAACQVSDATLSQNLQAIQRELEQQKDVSRLLPRLVVLERMLRQRTVAMDKQTSFLDEQLKHSGETLQRVAGLPAQLKRELRNLMGFSHGQGRNVDHAVKLLNIYERALKIITSNSRLNFNEQNSLDRNQLDCLATELQNAITELDFEGESGDFLLDIRTKLLLGVSAEALIELTLQVLKLVIEGTHFERKASEQFLEQLNASLAANLKTSHQNVDQSQTYFEQRQQFNKELGKLVAKSRFSVDNATELEQLKATVSPLLAQIESLSQRLSLAEEKEQVLQERLQYGQHQLEAVFDVTQDYRRRLEDQAQRMLLDPLTKVYNRTAFNDRLELEYRRWIRAQHNLRVVLLDIDSFKAINDSYGYTAGDKALKIIARTIRKVAADTDTVARFGGEEFILLIPEQTDEYSLNLVKKIQSEISKLPFKFREQQITITLSAVSTAFGEADNPEYVVDRLGTMLKESKQRGLNQLDWR